MDAVHFNPTDNACFRRIVFRQEDAFISLFHRHNGHRKSACNLADGSIQRQFSQKDRTIKFCLGTACRHQQREVDRQVINRSGLMHIGRSEIDGNFCGRDFKTGIFQGGTDPVPAFPDGSVRQTDCFKRGHPTRKVGFHLYNKGIHSKKTGAGYFGVHIFRSLVSVQTAARII